MAYTAFQNLLMPQAFAQTPQQQPFDPARAVGVGAGTTLEALVSMGSFGLWEPDIIPEDVEALHPIATIVGNIAGSVAGFVGTTMLTGAAISVPLKAFRFGRAILTGVALSKATIGTGALTMAGGRTLAQTAGFSIKSAARVAPQFMAFAPSVLKTAASFGAQDVAREYIQQAKAQDFNAYELGRAAVSGILTGGIFGTAHKMFSRSNPISQLIAGGSTFATAEAVNTVVEGKDITPELIAQSFLMGVAFTIPSAIRYRQTKLGAFEASKQSIKGFEIEAFTPGEPFNESVMRYIGKHSPQLSKLLREDGGKLAKVVDFKKIGRAVKLGVSRLPKETKGAKPAELSEIIRRAQTPESLKIRTRNERNRLLNLLDETQLATVGRIKDPTGRKSIRVQPGKLVTDYIETISGGRTRNIDKLTRAEMSQMYNDISTYMMRDIQGNILGGGDIRAFKSIYASAPIKKYGKSAEMLLIEKGMGDLIEVPTAARRAADEFSSKVMHSVIGAIEIIKMDAKKSPIFKGLKGETLRIRIGELLEIESKDGFAKILRQLTRPQRNAMIWMRRITDGLIGRQNEVRRQIGRPEIQTIAGYMHHVTYKYNNPSIFRYDPIETGKAKRKGGIGKATIGTAEQRTENLPYNKDVLVSFRAMTSMDAKDIFLNRSLEMMKAQHNVLIGLGKMTTSQSDMLIDYANTALLNVPSASTIALNKSLDKFFKSGSGRMDKVFNVVMEALNGQKPTGNPVTALTATWGKAVTNTFIALRPKLALRNMFQSLYMQPFVGIGNTAKAIGSATPERLKPFLKRSGVFRKSMMQSEEQIGSAQGFKSQVATEIFATSHGPFNVTNVSKGHYFKFTDLLNSDRKLATKSGKELRVKVKAAGVKNWREHMAPDEEQMFGYGLDQMIRVTQFVYDTPGMPGVFKSPAGKVAFKLQSYPMNYAFSYIDALWREAKTGRPMWLKGNMAPDFKLTTWERMGMLKHFVGLSLLIGGIRSAFDLDYSSIVGFSIAPDKITEGKGFGRLPIRPGVFGFRPSPAFQLFDSIQTAAFSENEYERKQAYRNLKTLGLIPIGAKAPGGLVAFDLLRATKEESRTGLLFKQVPKSKRRRRKRKTTPFPAFAPTPFGQ